MIKIFACLGLLNGQPIRILQSLDIEQRNKIIKQIKGIVGVTQRQIARVTFASPTEDVIFGQSQISRRIPHAF